MLRSLRKSIGIAKKTCMLTNQPSRSFLGLNGIFNSLRGQFRHAIEPGAGRFNTHTMEATETELFDEDAHEVQAMVTNNPFDLEVMMGDTNPLRNFGTIDNPVILFSANVGWRYVMCSGLNDEEEGLAHQGIWFILREGPLHRCSACGQCFKLINLKDEISEENDYYLEHYMPILEEEMGDDDDLVTRWTFHKFAEPYAVLHPHQNTNYAYILVNPDDHDRILTDPAYRMQKLYEGHQKLNDIHHALVNIEDKILWQRGGFYPKFSYSAGEYEDLITSEMAIRKLDRIFAKVTDFEKRRVLEPLDHERREKRMLEKAEERLGKNFVQYIGTNELEQKYNDYYESDYDGEEELINEQEDYEELVASGIFNFKNYEFVEEDLSNTVSTIGSLFDKKVFKFKHRKWNDDPVNHFIRENRMIKRYLDRLQQRDKAEFISENNLTIPLTVTRKRMRLIRENEVVLQKNAEYMVNEAVLQYKDYYESDTEDIKDFEFISPDEKAQFATIFKDYSKPLGDPKHVILTPKENSGKGLFGSLSAQLTDVRSKVIQAAIKDHKPNNNFQYHNVELKINEIDKKTLRDIFEDVHQIDQAGETGKVEDSQKFR